MELGRLQVLVSSQDVLRRFSSWTMLCIWASTHVKRTVQTRRVTALVMDASNNSFSDFMRNGKAVAPTILDTLKECLGPEIPDKVKMIYVVWHDGKIYVAGTFNCCLCMWRLLTLFFPKRFSGDVGCKALAELLFDLDVTVRLLKLSTNRIGDVRW